VQVWEIRAREGGTITTCERGPFSTFWTTPASKMCIPETINKEGCQSEGYSYQEYLPYFTHLYPGINHQLLAFFIMFKNF
jgi:hypothetical protein